MEPKVFAGKYRVERELGPESTGRTYLTDGPGGSRAIVKVVHPADAAAGAAIEADVALIAGIHHPVLPMVFEWGHDGADLFVVREYVPGADLELELGQQGRFAPLTAARYVEAASDGLAQIHRRGLVHGNVKAANLIRTPEDEIKLVGNSIGVSGSAALRADAQPSAAYYLAPEQVEAGASPSPATDVYAMGVVLYELITGHVPFDGPTAAAVADKQAHAEPAPIGNVEPEVPAALQAVIMRALEKSPQARYADGDALRAALHDVLEPAPAVTAAMPAPRKRSAWPWVIAGLAVVAMALVLAWALGAFGTHESAVPNLVGMTRADAAGALSAAGLQLGNVTFSGGPVTGIADGSVTSENPIAGTRVDPATKIDIVLAGSESVRVPDVVGLTEAQATAELQNAGLVSGPVSTVVTSAVAAGQITSQSPVAGTTADKGSTVSLSIAQAPSAPVVPDVLNRTRNSATSILTAAGFNVKVVLNSSATIASGRVIDQDPTAGVNAQTGSTVTIVVSSGPGTVRVPNVVGMTQADAVNALTAAGFKSQITLQTGGGTVGDVVDQSPNAGTRAVSGSTVTITVVQ